MSASLAEPAVIAPSVTLFTAPDGSVTVLMHEGTTIRHFVMADMEKAQKMIVSVAVDGFRMPQDQAQALAAEAVKTVSPTPDVIPQTVSDHIDLLEEQLADTQTQHTEKMAELHQANKRLLELDAENKELKARIEQYSATKASEVPVNEVPPQPEKIESPTAADHAPPNTAAPSVLETASPGHDPVHPILPPSNSEGATPDVGSGGAAAKGKEENASGAVT